MDIKYRMEKVKCKNVKKKKYKKDTHPSYSNKLSYSKTYY